MAPRQVSVNRPGGEFLRGRKRTAAPICYNAHSMGGLLSIAGRMGALPDYRVLKVSGRLAMDNVPEFQRAIRAETAKVLLLELADLAYIDSSGVGALVQQFSALRKDGRQLVLIQPHERVIAVLQITKVLSMFPRFASVQEAEAQAK